MGLANIAKTKGAADNAASRLSNKRGAVAIRVSEKPGHGILVSPLGAAPEVQLFRHDDEGLRQFQSRLGVHASASASH